MQTGLTHAVIEILTRFPKLGGLFGLLVAVAFGFLGIVHWNELQNMPASPERLALSEAVDRLRAGTDLWVEIEWVAWDCDNLVHTGSGSDADTEIVFTDETRSVLGVAEWSARLTCEEIQDHIAAGVLRAMSDGLYECLPGRGFDLAGYENADARLYLCTFCGRENSMVLVICAAVFVPLGLLMYPMCRIARRHYQRKGLL